MLNTKDVAGYLGPLAGVADSLTAVSIPGEANTLPAETTADAARDVGLRPSRPTARSRPCSGSRPRRPARILICGSLYLAGGILRENG